jgi:predicted PurR-regulated permease PerM
MSGDEPQQPENQAKPPGYPFPHHIRISIAPQTIWLAIGATIGTILLLLFLGNVLPVLLLLFAAITIAEAMRPAVHWMNRYHIPRWLGVLILYLLGLGILSALGYFISQPLVEQVRQFVDNLPEYTQDIEDFATQAQGAMNNLPGGDAIPTQIANLVSQIAPFIVSIPAIIIGILADIVITLFMALFWTAYSDGLREFTLSFFPPRLRRQGAQVLDEMSLRLGGYVHGVVINMFVIGVLSGIADWLLGLPFPLLLGVFAGLTEFIPLVGPFIGAAPAVLLGLVISPTKGLIVALVYLLIQQFEGHTLVPLVMNRVVKLRPLTILVALAVGTLLFGLEGALLAVPFAAVAQVFIVRVLAPWIRNTTGGDHHDTTQEEARPRAPNAPEAKTRPLEELHPAENHNDTEVGTRK